MAAPARATCSREKEVKITVDATGINVVPDRFHVSKSGNEEVVWTCNVAFTVDFEESPFNDTQFNEQFHFSGLVLRSVLPSTHALTSGLDDRSNGATERHLGVI